jgi:hypothetical protein
VLACLTIAMSTASCVTDEQRLSAAAREMGTLSAGVDLPDQPVDCRAKEAHAAVAAGTEVRSALIRERDALDRQNARGGRCAEFYDDLKARMARKTDDDRNDR